MGSAIIFAVDETLGVEGFTWFTQLWYMGPTIKFPVDEALSVEFWGDFFS